MNLETLSEEERIVVKEDIQSLREEIDYLRKNILALKFVIEVVKNLQYLEKDEDEDVEVKIIGVTEYMPKQQTYVS
jgi:hypothetical protein